MRKVFKNLIKSELTDKTQIYKVACHEFAMRSTLN